MALGDLAGARVVQVRDGDEAGVVALVQDAGVAGAEETGADDGDADGDGGGRGQRRDLLRGDGLRGGRSGRNLRLGARREKEPVLAASYR